MQADTTKNPAALTLTHRIEGGLAATWSVLAGILRRMANRQAHRHIREMDDHQLYDIGLCRDDLRSAAALPVGADPIQHLVRARHERVRGRRHC